MSNETVSTMKFSDFPITFQRCDFLACLAQKNHIWLVKVYILVGVICASLAQMCFSLFSDSRLKIIWLAILGTAVAVMIVVRWCLNARRWEQVWCRNRSAAEDIRSRTWYYMMGVELSQPSAANEKGEERSRSDFEKSIRAIEAGLSQYPEYTEHLAGGPEITETMDRVRSYSISMKRSFYLKQRLRDQMDWYGAKSRNYEKWSRWCRRISMFCEAGAMTLAMALAVHYGYSLSHPGSKLTLTVFMSPFLSGAAAVAAWRQYKRYPELSRMYGQQVARLAELQKDLLRCERQSDHDTFAGLVKECEDMLTQENRIWFIRREA